MREFKHELCFWENHLDKKDHFKGHLLKLLNSKKRKTVFPKIILKNFEKIMSDKKSLKVLDIGCGPTSGLAWAVDKNYFKVIGIDPLAREYKKMMKKRKYSYPIIPKIGYGEKILKKFKKESFDLVYSRNSLDHTLSATKTFKQMVSATKKEGFICIEFMKFEGTHAKWKGLHKHNLEIKGKNLFHYTKKGKKTVLNKNAELKFLDKITEGEKIGCWQSTLFQKNRKF